jgi:hypothetical protein
MSVTVYYTPYFKRVIRHLAKKYLHLQSDIKPVIQQLQEGELLGDLIQHIGYSVYKVRVKTRTTTKAKARVIE